MTAQCNRTRSLISQRLDGPLSELENRLVERHTARCADCLSFQADTEAFTALLRSAPLEPVPWPAATPLARPRRRIHVRAVAQAVSFASVVIAAATIVLTTEPPGGVAERPLVTSQGAASLLLSDESIRSLRRDALAEGNLQILPVSSSPPETPLKPALPVVG